MAAITVVLLVFISAPYGRHTRSGWGPVMPARWAWILMESPAVLLYCTVFFLGDHRFELVPLLLLGLWQVHYLHRTFIFPFRMRSSGKTVPLLIPALALFFNSLNAWINARWISHLSAYESSWLLDPRFLIGAGVFVVGLVINMHSDTVLLRLRKPGETDYKIPHGAMFRLVSSPNYLGELIVWAGWAMATWSWAGLAFFVYTAANLGPRAVQNHRWYQQTFPDYPPKRRILVPFIF